MKATVLDLRYRMKDIFNALDRNEKVTILYHGSPRGELIPIKHKVTASSKHHPLFNIRQSDDHVETIVNDLRGHRYHDL